MVLWMIAAGKFREKGIAVPAEFSFQTGLRFVVRINCHVFNQGEESA
jgi:hypothetical protein